MNPVDATFLRSLPKVELHVYEAVEDEAGIPYVIGSDDPPMLRTTLLNEYGLVHAKLGFDRRKFAAIALNGVKAAWLDEATRREWLGRWTRDIEELV